MNDPSIKRKLVAILYADVAGFSRLTHADEAGTYQALRVGLDRLTNWWTRDQLRGRRAARGVWKRCRLCDHGDQRAAGLCRR